MYRTEPETRPVGMEEQHLEVGKRLVVHPEGVTNVTPFEFGHTHYAVAATADFAMTELDVDHAQGKQFCQLD